MTSSTDQPICDHEDRINKLKNTPTQVGYSLANENDLRDYLNSVIVDVETCIAGDYETHVCKQCKKVLYARMHR